MHLGSAVLSLLAVLLPAVDVQLAGPLSTTVDLVGEFPAGEAILAAEVVVPADAPADLQVAAFAQEDGGGWRQSLRYRPLPPGRHHLALPIPGSADPATRAIGGLQFCTTAPGATLRIDGARALPASPRGDRHVYDLAWDGAVGPERAAWTTGQPWCLRLRPGRQGGFALAARVAGPDGAAIRLITTPPVSGAIWSLSFTPPAPGIYRVEIEGRWGGDRIGHQLELIASGPAPQDRGLQPASGASAQRPAPSAEQPEHLLLAAPLRTCCGQPVAEAAAACRISARLVVPADAPDDLTAAAYVRDGVGRWRQSGAIIALHPGEQPVALDVPAGAVIAGPGEAGLVLWSAQISTAALAIRDLRVEPQRRAAVGEPCLDRLRLDGVRLDGGTMTVPVGGTWSAAVMPEPAGAQVSARLSDEAGRSGVVPAVIEESGRHRVTFHPSIPGSGTVELSARWPDGRQLTCRLPCLVVTGEHPCRAGQTLQLRAPIATVMPLTLGPPATAGRLTATILVADGAPPDLALALAAVDHQDRWYESGRRIALQPGINRIDLPFDARSALAAAPGNGVWNEQALDRHERTALVFTSVTATPLPLTIGALRLEPIAAADRRRPRLLALAAAPEGRTGERWTLTLRPDPFPGNPFDPEEFRLDLLVTTPEGQQLALPGFYAEDMRAEDRGDRERLRALGSGRFEVRYRPRTPGAHRLMLQASWRDRGSVRCELPPLAVAGAAWDGYVRVDAKDPRFFAVDGRFYWPSGPNLRSVWDLRARDRMRTRLTPDRGTLAYQAYLRRFAAAGANACEIWMSAWNLALEWRRDWPGFDGVGRYNQENAWRLDRILDAAWAEGVRVNLVINNHGQGSDNCDAEWANNPYNRAAGGELGAAAQLFEAPYALRGQERLRRYLIARYADHPAVLGWKLWSEMNLTNGKQLLKPWHEQAVQRWHQLDPYGHPVTSHWSGDYRTPNHAIARLLDYVCIDAYHDDKPENPYRLVHRLLRDSTLGEPRGLAALERPVLVTEFGGNWSGTRNDALMQVDHASGAWAAFVSGHAGAPMLWWFEWIDQGGRFAPYGAIARFVAGEDLRAGGRPVAVQVQATARLWAAAWRTTTRVFGYVIDEDWAGDGTQAAPLTAQLAVDATPGGRLLCEWWDPDSGQVIASQRLGRGGGSQLLQTPQFRHHLAWKLVVQP